MFHAIKFTPPWSKFDMDSNDKIDTYSTMIDKLYTVNIYTKKILVHELGT